MVKRTAGSLVIQDADTPATPKVVVKKPQLGSRGKRKSVTQAIAEARAKEDEVTVVPPQVAEPLTTPATEHVTTPNEPGTLAKPVQNTAKKKATPKKKAATKKKIASAKKTAKKKTVKTTTAKKAPAKKATPKKTTKAAAKKATIKKKVDLTPMPPLSSLTFSTDGMKRHPLGHLLLEQKLRAAGFRGGISSDKKYLERYSTDESIFSVRPQVVLQPKTGKDVATAAKLVAEETKRFSSLSLTPRAAGTGLSGGSLTDSIVVDVCAHMKHIDEIVEKNGKITFSCEPGTMWRDIEKKLKKHDAYLPPFPASKDICSIGGSIGNNAAGPDSLRFGHCADWVESLEVVLSDGETYTIEPLTYKQYQKLIKEKHLYATLAKKILALIEDNEKEIMAAKPKTKKNSAGYPLWSVLSTSVAEFKKGEGTFDLTRLISGSQGTIGIITKITMRAQKIAKDTSLIVVPVFNLADAGAVVMKALEYNPINVEVFDALSFDLALKNPDFFKTRLSGANYYKVMLSMYTTYHVRYLRKIPEFTLLITVDAETAKKHDPATIARTISSERVKARVIKSPVEREMFWQIRRASYSLSKFQDKDKRPAAFLEDMTVPPKHLSAFFAEIKKLLAEFEVTAAVHGHGGNGHFHFYPLLDFTDPKTADKVEAMAEKFFTTAVKYEGNICGEHNDGIIRTPHLSKMFNTKTLDLFKQVEHLFDPDDIFNPGKKVNPRYDIKAALRKTN